LESNVLKRTTRQAVSDLLDREGSRTPREIAEKLGISEFTASSSKNAWRRARGFPVGTKQKPFKGGRLRKCVAELLEEKPNLTVAEIARQLGISESIAASAKYKADEKAAAEETAARGPRFRKVPAPGNTLEERITEAKRIAEENKKIAKTFVVDVEVPVPAVVTLGSLLDLASPAELGTLLLNGFIDALQNRDDHVEALEAEAKQAQEEHQTKEVEWTEERRRLMDHYNTELAKAKVGTLTLIQKKPGEIRGKLEKKY